MVAIVAYFEGVTVIGLFIDFEDEVGSVGRVLQDAILALVVVNSSILEVFNDTFGT